MVEIRTYDGDGSDLAELSKRIHSRNSRSSDWEPFWDAPFVRCQIEAPAVDRELMVAAYDQGRLVGSFFAVPYAFDVRGQSLPGTFSTCFMIDPGYRALGPYLIEKLRRRHRDNGYAFSLGFVMGKPGSDSYECWTNYARLSPQNCSFISDAGCWFTTFDPAILEGSSEDEQARLYSYREARSGESDPIEPIGVRDYRQSDLTACLDCLKSQIGKADCAIAWSEESLGSHLEGGENGQALVIDRAGEVHGFISYHQLPLWNGAKVRSAVFDLLATHAGDDALRRHLLSAACTRASEQGAQVAMALRSSMFRARVMMPAGFLPLPETGRMVMLFADRNLETTPSDDFAVMLR